MGVKGLLPILKSIHKPCSLKQFAGKTLGVDAYGWLHRGTIACAIELAQGRPTTKFVDFAMHRVRMLIHFGVKPFLVFDGDYLPSKKGTEVERAARRKEARDSGLELLRMGRSQQAYLELQKSIDVTPEMARQLMDELDKAKIDFIVAPYEADSQLVYLEGKGIIDGIVSEDSDMLVFGAETLLTKLDQYGQCVAIYRKDLTSCRELSLAGWTDEEFRWMAILSGCDYLPAIGSVGLKTAHRLIRKHKSPERVVKALQFDGKTKIPPSYLEDFRNANLTFLHQWVYCPVAKDTVNIRQVPDDLDVSTLAFIGKKVDAATAQAVARGRLNPHTKQPLRAPTGAGGRKSMPLQKFTQDRKTPELRKHQSIESFFKAKRTPLGELDPNVFTPSPSQQRLLEQQQQEWVAQETPTKPLPPVRAATDLASAANGRRAFSAMQTSSARQTSPKRQRLCSDIGLPTPPTASASKFMTSQSRFFAKTPTQPSPLVAKASRHETKKASQFNIWSDDSIEEAMLQIADCADEPIDEVELDAKGDTSIALPDTDLIPVTDFFVASEVPDDTQTTTASANLSIFSHDESNSASTTQTTLASQSCADKPSRSIPASQSLGLGRFAMPSSPPPLSLFEPKTTNAPEPLLKPATATKTSHDDNDGDIIPATPATTSRIRPPPLKAGLDAIFTTHHEPTTAMGSEDLLLVPTSSDDEVDLLAPSTPPGQGHGRMSFGLNLGKFAYAA